MTMKRPATMEAFQELVNQALIEVEELRFSIEFDEEFMVDALSFVGELENQLKDLLAEMQAGNYEFKEEDLPFMQIVKGQNKVILPFKGLLTQINSTHRLGLEE